MPHGVGIPAHAVEFGFGLDPDGFEPLDVKLIHRPYGFLQDGDEVVGQEGRVWAFSAPWKWTAFDEGPGESPEWPLRLIFRGGKEAEAQDLEEIAGATISGSHSGEIAKWMECAGLDAKPELPPLVFT
ncbi:hypothetical protein [Streptomyces sp. NPDC006274]|uniref:hypothetical protein n=1 Tax=unclassified Streptomyces TaxID=2593676 RepID=UPI0033BF320A